MGFTICRLSHMFSKYFALDKRYFIANIYNLLLSTDQSAFSLIHSGIALVKMGWLCSFINSLTNLEQAQGSTPPDVRRFRLQALPLPGAGGRGWSLSVQSVHLMQLHAKGGLGVQLHGTAAPDGWLQPRWVRPRPPLGGQRQQRSGPSRLATQASQERPLPIAPRGGRGDEEQRLQRERNRITRQWKPRQRESWQREQRPWVDGQLQWQQQRLCTTGVFWKQQEVSGCCGNDDAISKPVWFLACLLCKVKRKRETRESWAKQPLNSNGEHSQNEESAAGY